MPWARSLTESVAANLIASAITGAIAGLIGRANDLPTLSVTLLGIGAFSITLLMLMLMAVRFDRRAKAEAALPLLREVGIHMLLNRPLNNGALERFGENMAWWRGPHGAGANADRGERILHLALPGPRHSRSDRRWRNPSTRACEERRRDSSAQA